MWNKAKDKLPTKEGDYQVYYHYVHNPEETSQDVARYFPENKERNYLQNGAFIFQGRNYHKEGNFTDHDDLCKITHWQDLPEPPNKENK